MWRRNTIANVETVADTEVWEYSLPTSGILSGVFFQLRGTNGSTSNLDNALEQCVNAIQLIDGGRVLLDLTGPQAQFLSLLAGRGHIRSVISEGADDEQTYQALILFGMHLFDDEVGLDLSKLRNPKLRVDVDLTSVRAAGVTGYVTGSARISGVLFINDGEGQPSPDAYIKSHEIKRWTTAASGDETTQAPVDGPWVRLVARAHVANNNPDAVLSAVKVSFDSGQFVALDELTRWAADGFGLLMGFIPRFALTLFRADTETRDLRHGGIDSVTGLALVDTNVACLAGFEAGRPTVNLNVLGAGTTQATEDDIYVTAVANCPYMCMVWDFVGQGFLEVAEWQRGDIVMTQGVAAAAASLVLQQKMLNVAR